MSPQALFVVTSTICWVMRQSGVLLDDYWYLGCVTVSLLYALDRIAESNKTARMTVHFHERGAE